MSPPAQAAQRPTFVASHERQVATQARHQNREEGESEPTAQPVAVAVGAVAGVDVVALRVGHAVVQQTLGTLAAVL